MKKYQSGASLIVALIFMAIISLIGVSMALNTNAEEKQTRNFRDRDLANMGAEAALRDAEIFLNGSWTWPYTSRQTLINNFDSTCTDGLCDSVLSLAGGVTQDSVDFFTLPAAGTGVANAAIVLGSVTKSPDFSNSLASAPRYRIEAIATVLANAGAVTSQKAYRITAQAKGQSSDTRVILQEIYLPADSTN